MGVFIDNPITLTIFAAFTFAIAAFLKPAFLAGRDYTIWQLIDVYIKRSGFSKRAHQYASNKAKYNSLQKETLKMSVSKNGDEKFYIGDDEVEKAIYRARRDETERTKETIFNLQRRLDKETLVIGSALRHYSQESSNPATLIIHHYEEIEFLRRGLEYPDSENR
ncbi:hypothetical protein [Halomonas cerina]|uniref:Uncharacterized protein n=1 Tax=Halomonas cerina TaxID=447424 RepID=A0A839VI18_9GAMM|nr:hypothetical protein [Halomonas cerina]MBB3192036.1 hypothetical protein [Halomonas cerina]